MILIAKASFPPTSLKEAAKIFSRLPKLPATVKRHGPFFRFDEKGNFLYFSLFKFSEARISFEEKKFLLQRLQAFRDVPGFASSVEEWMNMEETLDAIKKGSADETARTEQP